MRIHERHRDFGLLDRVHQLIGRPAVDSEILAVHTQEYLDRYVIVPSKETVNISVCCADFSFTVAC